MEYLLLSRKPRAAHAPSRGLIICPALGEHFLPVPIVLSAMVEQVRVMFFRSQSFGCGALRVRHGILSRDELFHV